MSDKHKVDNLEPQVSSTSMSVEDVEARFAEIRSRREARNADGRAA